MAEEKKFSFFSGSKSKKSGNNEQSTTYFEGTIANEVKENSKKGYSGTGNTASTTWGDTLKSTSGISENGYNGTGNTTNTTWDNTLKSTSGISENGYSGTGNTTDTTWDSSLKSTSGNYKNGYNGTGNTNSKWSSNLSSINSSSNSSSEDYSSDDSYEWENTSSEDSSEEQNGGAYNGTIQEFSQSGVSSIQNSSSSTSSSGETALVKQSLWYKIKSFFLLDVNLGAPASFKNNKTNSVNQTTTGSYDSELNNGTTETSTSKKTPFQNFKNLFKGNK